MKKIVFLSLFTCVTLFAGEPTMVDVAAKKITEVVNNVKKTASEFQNKIAIKTKEVAHKGQSIAMDKTIINGINATLDKKYIEVKYLKKNTKTNVITMVMYLNGEKKYLGVTLKDFKWGYSKDEEHIILEKINVALSIPWIDYLVHDSLKRDGYIVLPNYLSIADFLETIKPATKTTYTNIASKPFNPLAYNFDTKQFDIKTFVLKNKIMKADVKLGGSENLKFEVTKFDVYTANKRKFIVLKNINFKYASKPWLSYIIKSWNNSLKFDFDKDFYEILASGNYEYKQATPAKAEKKESKKVKKQTQKAK
jgi:hypothetical protein